MPCTTRRELRNVIDRAIALAPGARRFADLVIRIDPAQHDVAAGDGLAVRSDLPYAEAKALVLHELERRDLADILLRATRSRRRSGAVRVRSTLPSIGHEFKRHWGSPPPNPRGRRSLSARPRGNLSVMALVPPTEELARL